MSPPIHVPPPLMQNLPTLVGFRYFQKGSTPNAATGQAPKLHMWGAQWGSEGATKAPKRTCHITLGET